MIAVTSPNSAPVVLVLFNREVSVAIKQKGVEKQLRAVASMNPDNFVQGGLMDDFDGTINKVRFVPWDYDGKIDHHVLAVAVTIKPEDGDAFVQHYSAGDLNMAVPTMDGENPVDLDNGSGEELEGKYALLVGKATALRGSTNWAHFLEALCACEGFDRARLQPNVDSLEGISGHFNRVPQKKRSGIQVTATTDGKPRSNDVLVITKINDMNAEVAAAAPASASKSGTKATTKAATATATKTTPAADDVADTLTGVIVEALSDGDGTLAKSKLVSLVLKKVQGADRARAIKLANDASWLGANDAFSYDADSGTLSLG